VNEPVAVSSKTVAFQGADGAYSQEAALEWSPDATTLPCRTFAEVFEAVVRGRVGYGAVPVENSLAGSINQAYDLLLEHDLRIAGEVLMRIRHNLLALPRTRLEDVRRVYSHPQALAQCEQYLARRGLAAVAVYDTAGAALHLREAGADGAIIAGRRAAEIHGLDVLAEGIEDLEYNYTRFFIVSRDEAPRGPRSKTSLVFATRHRPGDLYEALGEFATRGVNLTKLESRPRRTKPWQYVFYVDFEGHQEDEAPSAALLGLLRKAAFVKVLGSYPAAPPIDPVAAQGGM
jgi:prephenate dehydratase